MSVNKNNPNAMDKLMGYLKQLSTDMSGSDQQRRQTDEERSYKSRGPKYARVPSKATLSASTTCTSLATSCGSSATLAPHYATIPERNHTPESSSEDEQETFEKTRLHFQQLRQISLGNEYKYKMEMEVKSAKDENIRSQIPYVDPLTTDSGKKREYSVNGDSKPYAPAKQRSYLCNQVLAAFSVSLGSMIAGFSAGYTSPALPSMMNNTTSTLKITDDEGSWVSSLMPLAAAVGGIVGGPLIDHVGRRNTITATALPFFAGWMLIANATSVHFVFAGRALCGICVGIGSLAFPVYLAEVVQSDVRGVLGLLPTAFGNIGILLCNIIGPYLDWSQLAFVATALPVPFFFLMLTIPESPNWFMSRNRVDDARKALQWLRGGHANVDREIKDIALSKAETERLGSSGLFQKKYARSVAITMGLMLFQQLAGINVVIFNTTSIFLEAGSKSIDGSTSAIIVAVVNFISTFIATALIDRLGRKILLYVSAVSIIMTLGSLGAYFYLKHINMDVEQYGWIPLASLIIYVLGFSLGLGPVPWLMMGEILPASIRGSAAALATAFNWMCTFVVTKTYPNMLLAVGSHGTFWAFAGITLVGLFFILFFVPETRGKSLEEIEAKLTGSSSAGTKRQGSPANLKPMSNVC